jgi:hypothetical protein
MASSTGTRTSAGRTPSAGRTSSAGLGVSAGRGTSAGRASSAGHTVSSVSSAQAGGGGRLSTRLPYSNAAADVVQAQPAPGSCHAIGSGLYSRPDPHCTPGALNPAVTQATLGQTICHSGWTKTVRPPTRITDREKAESIAAYGDPGPVGAYEYDHFVPLELGGAVNDARNLWPEPGGSPNPKDTLEGELRRQVCDGAMTLAHAQRAIAANWVALARSPHSTTTTVTHAAQTPADCTLSASYSSRYHDYDVYVHSNQPDQTVIVTDQAGHMARWHTDASGYADVFLRAPANEAGGTVTAHVGGSSCRGAL